ncbi:MAG TPA: hypothetical protein VF480_11255 [Verrucomicrobiae bacterium]
MATGEIGHDRQDDFIVLAHNDFLDVVNDLIGDGRHDGISRLTFRGRLNLWNAHLVGTADGNGIIRAAMRALDWLACQGGIDFKRLTAVNAGDFRHNYWW